ncbi:M12 family metallopeptidase [Pedosphaera parvula]|uniref:Peptidase M12A astacin n=1 Tax=Pedosphaera parvula (strain Ellin514) TaxID=320771 RepID=B9XSD7_PEDPL|nr:M12 family metallopeptidase [Pedosphaera parvula]EEF57237.1 peptidase M12A astacin [Pedosphaera parvula Ellin514]
MATTAWRLYFIALFFAARFASAADSNPAHVDAVSAKPIPWPGGIIPYDISKLSEAQQVTAKAAMNRWMDTGARITFIPHTTETEYVNFTGQTNSGNNTSLVGFQKGARADINITSFWWRQGDWMPAHELGHVLGFFHEHARWDRDSHVTIHYENIKEGRQSDYDWIPKTNWIVSTTAYDYRSIMHYRTCWTSKCESECKDGDGSSPCVVIAPLGKEYDKVIGQWGDNGISATDAEKARLAYGTKPSADSKLTKQDK